MSKIAIIWDLMIDKYTFWKVKRLNPEAPVPLINVEKEEERLWWAANVAANVASLNENVNLIWLVWNDEGWEKLKNLCKKEKINLIWIPLLPFTIVKQRFVESTYHQQLLRVDYEKLEEIWRKSEEIWKKITESLAEINPEIIIISDYAKWTLNPKSIKLILENFWNKKILVDTKPKNALYYQWVYILKPNFKEFCQIIWKEIQNEEKEIERYWKELVKKLNIEYLVITRWEKGASLIWRDWKTLHIPTEAKQVFDVTWAWDTFIATLWWAISEGYSIQEAVKLANKASWIVVWKVWTAIITKEELLNS